MSLRASNDLAISSLVLSSKTLAELEARLREQSLLSYADEVPGVLLAHVRAVPSDDIAWRALYHYRSQADGAYSESFSFDCFVECLTDLKLFAERYIQGDDKILSLLDSAVAGTESNIPAYASWTVEHRKTALKKAFRSLSDLPLGAGQAAVRRNNLIQQLKARTF